MPFYLIMTSCLNLLLLNILTAMQADVNDEHKYYSFRLEKQADLEMCT